MKRRKETNSLPDPLRAHEYFQAKLDFTTGPVELNRRLDDDRIVIVDVRAAEDYAAGHVPGAINVPEPDWNRPEGLARDKLNVLYCYSQVCHLAARAAVQFSAEGYPVQEMEGGFEAWKAHELPVEGHDEAAATRSAAPIERSPAQENL